MRHKWNSHDACERCGMVRSGYSGGRTGSMSYYKANGKTLDRAGPCLSPSPMLVEAALRRAAERTEAQAPVVKHCDDYIDDPASPEPLRKWLARARMPAHGMMESAPHPVLFATHGFAP